MNRTLFMALALATMGCGKDPTSVTDVPRTPLSAVDDSAAPVTPRPNTDAGPLEYEPPPPSFVRDRAGRPFVSQLLISEANRVVYNEADFAPPYDPMLQGKSAATTIGDDVVTSSAALDGLDGKADWTPEDSQMWLDDMLVVDPTKPFSADGYLEVELSAGANATCGGRWLADDAVDKTLSFLIAGDTQGVADGVDAPSRPPSLAFPYFAAPH